MINSEWLYWLIGAFFIAVAVLEATNFEHPKRVGSSLFWGILGLSFFYGTFVAAQAAPAWVLGITVLVMVALAGFGFIGAGPGHTTSAVEREQSAVKLRNRLFIPALAVPAVTVVVAVAGPMVSIGEKPLLAEGTATLTGLGIGGIVAMILAFVVLRPKSAVEPLKEGTRLLEAIGWAALLPQMLSTLGSLFNDAGVGDALGTIFGAIVPEGSHLWAVIAYTVGLAVFTIIMGNAFAAFPIMTAAVGWPVLVEQFGGDPAGIFALGMLAGFCGALCTPMAANFNIVPAALLEMKNNYGAIKVQWPSAVILLVIITAVMYFFTF